jgi:hypothetical protein
VKNQQGSATEVLPIKAGEGFAVLNFLHSRDRLSGESVERAARLAQTAKQFASSRRRRRSVREAHRQTRVFPRNREKSTEFGSGSVENRSG